MSRKEYYPGICATASTVARWCCVVLVSSILLSSQRLPPLSHKVLSRIVVQWQNRPKWCSTDNLASSVFIVR